MIKTQKNCNKIISTKCLKNLSKFILCPSRVHEWVALKFLHNRCGAFDLILTNQLIFAFRLNRLLLRIPFSQTISACLSLFITSTSETRENEKKEEKRGKLSITLIIISFHRVIIHESFYLTFIVASQLYSSELTYSNERDERFFNLYHGCEPWLHGRNRNSCDRKEKKERKKKWKNIFNWKQKIEKIVISVTTSRTFDWNIINFYIYKNVNLCYF